MFSDPRRPKRDPKCYQQKNGYWYVRFYQRGKTPSPKWVTTGVRTKYRSDWRSQIPPEVQEMKSQWSRLWRDGKYDPWSDDRPGQVTIHKAIKAYLAQHEGADQTVKAHRTTLNSFSRDLTSGLAASSVHKRHVKAFLSQPQLKPYSRNAYYNRLRTFFKFCMEKHWVYDDPTEDVDRPPEPDTTRSIYLPDELGRILIAIHEDVGTRKERDVCLDAHEFYAVTGLRLSELCSRVWSDVDLQRNTIRVDDQTACDFTTKNEASKRIIPLFPRAQDVLRRRHEKRISESPLEPVFLAPRHYLGNPFVSGDWLSRTFTEYREAAGLSEGTVHSLRHTFITFVLALGIPESKVMRMTGHVKHDTIARYTHIVEELLQEAPEAALARYLPDYEASREPRLLKEIATFMAGDKYAPQKTA